MNNEPLSCARSVGPDKPNRHLAAPCVAVEALPKINPPLGKLAAPYRTNRSLGFHFAALIIERTLMLQPWQLRVTSLLDDPILLDWAVHHYAKIPPHSELKEQLGEQWFHHLNLKRLMDAAATGTDTDVDSLRMVLRDAPAKYFTPFATTIATRWSEWLAERVAHVAEARADQPAQMLTVALWGEGAEKELDQAIASLIDVVRSSNREPPDLYRR